MLTSLTAQVLLAECTGDDIWPVDLCTAKGVPEAWVNELADTFESGFRSDDQTIYFDGRVVGQFRGVRDVDLAVKLAEFLGVESTRYLSLGLPRAVLVQSLKEAVEEDAH
jgi:hypothetical protein